MFFLIALVIHFVNSWGDRIDTTIPESITAPMENIAGAIKSNTVSVNSNSGSLTVDQYIEAHTPRIPDVPWSAPVYDALTVPKTFPRPQCIRFNRGYDSPPVCKCYTQQATPLNLSDKACNRYVDNGYFDHTRPEIQSQTGQPTAKAHDQGLPRALAAAPQTSL